MTDNKQTLQMIANAKSQFIDAMPNFFRNNSTRFFMAINNEFRKVPKLMECTPETLIGAIGSAASLGLEFGPSQHCFMIPYDKYKKSYNRQTKKWENETGPDGKWLIEKTECQLQIGYKGYINLYMRNPLIEDVYSYLVYEGDEFKIKYGTHPTIEHAPSFKPGRQLQGGYCVAKFKNTNRVLYLTNDDFLKSKAASKTSDKGPWVDWFDDMCLKTCYKKMKNHIDWAPDLAQLFQYDETIGAGFQLDDRDTIDINHEEVKQHNQDVKNRSTEEMMKAASVKESKNA